MATVWDVALICRGSSFGIFISMVLLFFSEMLPMFILVAVIWGIGHAFPILLWWSILLIVWDPFPVGSVTRNITKMSIPKFTQPGIYHLLDPFDI